MSPVRCGEARIAPASPKHDENELWFVRPTRARDISRTVPSLTCASRRAYCAVHSFGVLVVLSSPTVGSFFTCCGLCLSHWRLGLPIVARGFFSAAAVRCGFFAVGYILLYSLALNATLYSFLTCCWSRLSSRRIVISSPQTIRALASGPGRICHATVVESLQRRLRTTYANGTAQ